MIESRPNTPSVEEVFVRAILFDPADEEPRLIYADWLEERGDARGEFLRLDVALAKMSREDPAYTETFGRRTQAAAAVDLDWIARIATAPIGHCPKPLQFAFLCPKKWEQLRADDADHSIRFCSECQKTVHYCDSLESARQHARAGMCVAIDRSLVLCEGDLEDLPPDDLETISLGVIMEIDE